MLNLGESADGVPPERALALAANRISCLMTLSERVHSLFEQLRVPVFRYLLRKTRDPGKAEDMTQETFLRLFRHLREDRLLDNPKAWLFTVANNLSIDASREESHFKDLDETAWKRIEDSKSGLQADPEKLVLQRDRLDRLHNAVLNLTPLQRECLHLRAEGLRYREIAGLMKISPSTVMDAVRRATLKLAREFGGEVSA
jgi:RNA polymerase sigma-70 factor, ECF subfamily